MPTSGPKARSGTPSERITQEVTSWPGVEAGPGRRGRFVFRAGRREDGHLHGEHADHFNFPQTVWAELMQDGRIGRHPVFPDARGPAAHGIESAEDIREVIALLRLNHDHVGRGEPGERRGGGTR